MICRISYLLSSLPTFWIAMLLLALLVSPLAGALPTGCARDPGTMQEQLFYRNVYAIFVLPVCALSLLGMGQIALHTREKNSQRNEERIYSFCARSDKGWSLLSLCVTSCDYPSACLQLLLLGELMGSVTGRKVFCVSGAGAGHHRCRPAWRCPATHGDRFILYAISVCRKYDFSPLVVVLNRSLERPDALMQSCPDVVSSDPLRYLSAVYCRIRLCQC